MKMQMALAGVSALLITGAPSHAEPATNDLSGIDPTGLIASLTSAGISYADPTQAVSAAKAVCDMVAGGKSGLEVLHGLMTANPGFTTDGAAQFAAIAAHSYCPHQLASDGGGER